MHAGSEDPAYVLRTARPT